MEYLLVILDFFIHLNKHLEAVVLQYGTWTYALLFLIVFCETGLVVTPILPGDSLLFVAGTLAASGALNVWTLVILLFCAAVLGDAVNYHIGKYLGAKVFEGDSRIFKRKYLERTHRFYEKYGGKTIIFARFVPIVRTFAPFLAGVGVMNYRHFAIYNLTGAALWVFAFIFGGYIFGQVELVKNNFTFVIFGIILISIMPALIEAWRSRRETQQAA